MFYTSRRRLGTLRTDLHANFTQTISRRRDFPRSFLGVANVSRQKYALSIIPWMSLRDERAYPLFRASHEKERGGSLSFLRLLNWIFSIPWRRPPTRRNSINPVYTVNDCQLNLGLIKSSPFSATRFILEYKYGLN